MVLSKNLLKNSCAKDGLDGWKVTASGGDGFKCAEMPAGCKPFPENKESPMCWSTSYAVCMKDQMIDLVGAGFKPDVLDNTKPRIEVSDWYAPHQSCGCEYYIFVKLLGQDKETVIDKFRLTDRMDEGGDWKQAKHVFENYASGVRYVEFSHGGKDLKYWAGHYGVRVMHSAVFIDAPNTTGDSIGKNLLDNPNAKDGVQGWTILSNGGDGFVNKEHPFKTPDNGIPVTVQCWATSFALCSKTQLVDLVAKGIDVDTLDKKRPKIHVRDWYTPRGDCGYEYQISVRLLGEDKEKAIEKWELACTRDEGAGWMKAEHSFKRYPVGVRYVEFTHGGKDTKYWKGNYGVYMTKSMVKVGKKKVKENLIVNSTAKDGLDSWEVTQSGGDGWKHEPSPLGCEPIDNASCWSTSFGYCEKEQMVDLTESSFSGEKIDKKRPDITIIDWYGPRFDCGCEYRIVARLLAADKQTELDKWEFSDKMEANADWKEARYVFKDYPEGARYILFKHGGKDSRYWAGNFGVKVTKSGVYVGAAPPPPKREPGKNLLMNPCAKDGINGWEVTTSGGSGFAVEENGAGCKPLTEFNSDAKGNSCWATSHQDCEKRQMIDLMKAGYKPDYLNRVQPDILISDWFGVRSDAGCVYWLIVRLLNSNKHEIDRREFREEKGASGDWFQVEECFTNYGSGARFVEFIHGGRDTRGWAGRYGAKITCSSVRLGFPDDALSSSSDDE